MPNEGRRVSTDMSITVPSLLAPSAEKWVSLFQEYTVLLEYLLSFT